MNGLSDSPLFRDIVNRLLIDSGINYATPGSMISFLEHDYLESRTLV
jgi:hypothetical protein